MSKTPEIRAAIRQCTCYDVTGQARIDLPYFEATFWREIDNVMVYLFGELTDELRLDISANME